MIDLEIGTGIGWKLSSISSSKAWKGCLGTIYMHWIDIHIKYFGIDELLEHIVEGMMIALSNQITECLNLYWLCGYVAI